MTIPAYAPAPPMYTPAPPKKSHTSRILIALLVVSLIAVSIAWVMQYRETTKAVDVGESYKSAWTDTKATLKDTRGTLATTKESLDQAESERDDYSARLSECLPLSRVGRLLGNM